MPQLHFYVPAATAEALRARARALGLSVSRYLAQVVSRDVAEGWPEGFFTEVVGAWEGDPLERAPQGVPERREPL